MRRCSRRPTAACIVTRPRRKQHAGRSRPPAPRPRATRSSDRVDEPTDIDIQRAGLGVLSSALPALDPASAILLPSHPAASAHRLRKRHRDTASHHARPRWAQPFPFTAGQAVYRRSCVRATVRRPYSIACSPQHAALPERTRAARADRRHDFADPHLERLAGYTSVDIDGPLGSFGLPPDSRERGHAGHCRRHRRSRRCGR